MPGSIYVLPDVLTAAAGDFAKVAHGMLEVHGVFRATASAAGSCDPRAAGAYDQMQQMLDVGMAKLETDVGTLGVRTAKAASAYSVTDRHALPKTPLGDGS